MLYAKLHTYTDISGAQQTSIAATNTQPDATWVAYDVNNADQLEIVNGAIQIVSSSTQLATTLASAQADQITLLYGATTDPANTSFNSSMNQDVTITTAGGVTKAFQATEHAQSMVAKSLTNCSAAGTVPTGFYWVATDNTQVPFTLADLKTLAASIFAQSWAVFQKMQNYKDTIMGVTSMASWTASNAQVLNDQIVDGSGNIYKCTTAGTTAATAPVWPTSPTTATTVTDGTVVWTFVQTQLNAIQTVTW